MHSNTADDPLDYGKSAFLYKRSLSVRYQEINSKKHLKYQATNILYMTNMLVAFILVMIITIRIVD